MRLAVRLALLLAASQAWATNPFPGRGFGRPMSPFGLPPPTVELARFDFTVPGCYPSGSAMGSHGETLTSTRAGTRLCQTGADTLVTCQANELCVESRAPRGPALGLAVETARQNSLPFSASPCTTGDVAKTPWTLTNATCLNDVALDPTGSTSFDEITNSVPTGGAFNADVSSTQTGRYWVVSSWVKKVSSGPVSVGVVCTGASASACRCYRSDDAACTATISGNACYVVTTVGTASVRVAAIVTCSGNVLHPSVALVPGELGVSTGTARFWNTQLEGPALATNTNGSAYPGGDIVNDQATGVTARPVQIVSLSPTPLTPRAVPWCVKARMRTMNGRDWGTSDLTNTSAGKFLWTSGTATGDANHLYFQLTRTTVSARVYDWAGFYGNVTGSGAYFPTYDTAFHYASQSTEAYPAGGLIHYAAIDGKNVAGAGVEGDLFVSSPVAAPFRIGYNVSNVQSALEGWMYSLVFYNGKCR